MALRKVIRHSSSIANLYFVSRPLSNSFSNYFSSSSSSSSSISIDRSSLYNPPDHSHQPHSHSDLSKHLQGIIKFRGGPISVGEYMSQVLTNPKSGYYINRDVFGAQGDFITSPEVSQMFGEMVGVWVMCLWDQMGQPQRLNLVELGPGRGTLMADLLRGVSKFKNLVESLDIHLVECSPALQKLQHQKLKCVDEENAAQDTDKRTVSSLVGSRIPVSWHATMEQPLTENFSACCTPVPTIIIGHEFFDALPVHQFQKVSRGWCEKMVDVAEDSSFRFVLSPQPTPATLYLLKRCKWAAPEEIAELNQIEVCPQAMELTETIVNRISSDGGGALIIDYGFNGVISDSLQYPFVRVYLIVWMNVCVTRPAIRHIYTRKKPAQGMDGPNTNFGPAVADLGVDGLRPNINSEPATAEAGRVVWEKQIGVSYAEDSWQQESGEEMNSFKSEAIRKHKFVDLLDDPGSADLSAYVDFPSIRHSAEEASGEVSVHGPITQSQFLGSLGINYRVEALLQNCTEEQAESLRTGYWRLVGDGEAPFWEGPDECVPIGMGTRYKVMAIVNKKQGVPVPFQ
ncbi:hypothetical protein Lal_00029301 [Lupinus albus]|nr:hypothetical protein Lal_00029301 [Lupinus albus]